MLDETHFRLVLEQVANQVFEGKGRERHGNGTPFESQPWKHIVDNVGDGFTTGQALKKIFELKSLKGFPAYEREILGAIVYLVMSLMYKQYQEKKLKDEIPF